MHERTGISMTEEEVSSMYSVTYIDESQEYE